MIIYLALIIEINSFQFHFFLSLRTWGYSCNYLATLGFFSNYDDQTAGFHRTGPFQNQFWNWKNIAIIWFYQGENWNKDMTTITFHSLKKKKKKTAKILQAWITLNNYKLWNTITVFYIWFPSPKTSSKQNTLGISPEILRVNALVFRNKGLV